jgi:hypothetical protein
MADRIDAVFAKGARLLVTQERAARWHFAMLGALFLIEKRRWFED